MAARLRRRKEEDWVGSSTYTANMERGSWCGAGQLLLLLLNMPRIEDIEDAGAVAEICTNLWQL